MADDVAQIPELELRRAYYQRIGRFNMAPLWESLHDIVPRQPNGAAVAHRWDYDGSGAPVPDGGGQADHRPARPSGGC